MDELVLTLVTTRSFSQERQRNATQGGLLRAAVHGTEIVVLQMQVTAALQKAC